MPGADGEADGVRVDLHVKVLDDAVVERAKQRGLDALVYAPHFTRLPDVREAAARYSDDELLVVPGRELFTGDWRSRKHVLAVGLSDPVPDFLSLAGTMAELDRQDAAVLVPHPTFLTVSLSPSDLGEYRDVVDAVEVYNPKHWGHHNRRAADLASEYDLPAFGSSYAHLAGTVGEVWTTVEAAIDDEAALVEALRTGVPRRVEHRDGLGHELRRRLEFAHLGWENTWKKFDRLYLQGTEPTHPAHVFYGDQFEHERRL
jgi:predicted metal-dependent phosphoesterase TrpH